MLKLVLTKIKNTKDVDIYVKDAFGKEHMLFPKEEKRLIVLKEGKKNGRS